MNEEQVEAIVEAVVLRIVPQVIQAQAPAIQVQDKPAIIYTDDYLKVCLDAKSKIMMGVATRGKCDTVYARSNRGTTEINQTKDALNLIDDQIAEWKDRKTHKKV